MTKVNLLPDYIWEGKRRRRTVMLVVAALAVEAVLLGLFFVNTSQALTAAEAERDEWQAKAAEVDQINTKAEGIVSTIAPITNKTKYINDIMVHNNRFPNLFERTNMYTYSRIGYRQLQPAMNVLNMTATARNVSDIGRYLLNIQRAKDAFAAVSITSQMPGWSAANAAGGGAGAAPGGYPGAIAQPTGYPGGGGGYPGGAGGYPGGFPGGGTTADTAAPAAPNLLDFTAVAQLTEKFTLTPPTYAGAATTTDATGAGTGAATGMSGYPSGYPAGPGGASQYRPTGPPAGS